MEHGRAELTSLRAPSRVCVMFFTKFPPSSQLYETLPAYWMGREKDNKPTNGPGTLWLAYVYQLNGGGVLLRRFRNIMLT